MKSRFDAHCYAIAIIILGLAIAFLPGSCQKVEGKDTIVTNKYVSLPYASDSARYEAEVIADLDQFLREHGDNSKLLRIIDHDAQAVIYVILNDTGEMFTGLQVLSRKDIHVHAPLYKRSWR
jgi:hypothetical protein